MTIKIAREKTRIRHYVGYSFRKAARVLLYVSSHIAQDSTYHDLCYTSCGEVVEASYFCEFQMDEQICGYQRRTILKSLINDAISSHIIYSSLHILF